MNYEVRRKDKQFSFKSITAEAMTARGMGPNHRKGKREFGKSKSDGCEELKKNQCAFCREEWHWKIDYLKNKLKKKESKSEANITQAHGNDSDLSGYLFSITPISCCSEESEWILDMGTTYHICPKRERFASFKKLDGSFGVIRQRAHMPDWRDMYSLHCRVKY